MLRVDPMAAQTPMEGVTGYAAIMQNRQLEREEAEIKQKIQKMREEQGKTMRVVPVVAYQALFEGQHLKCE